MADRFSVKAAVYVLLLRDESVLLQRRYNTGFMDGRYGLPAGHLEADEGVRKGAAREAAEELGVVIEPHDLTVVHVMHRRAAEDERIDFFLRAHRFRGEPKNCEPDRCDDLRWFPLAELPSSTIDYVRVALDYVRQGAYYSEFGFEAPAPG